LREKSETSVQRLMKSESQFTEVKIKHTKHQQIDSDPVKKNDD